MTGVSPGSLGAEAALQIARHGANLLILTGRSMPKLKDTESQIKSGVSDAHIRLLELDLASQKQIRKAAEEVNQYPEPINVLINSAAIMAAPYSRTQDGLESQFGTNHIGHFLFTNLIMEKILAAGKGARIVNVSSAGHRRSPIRFDDYNWGVSSDCIVTFKSTDKYSRTVRLMISGVPTGKERQRTFCSPWN